MLGVWAYAGADSNAITAAARKTLMECSPAFSLQYTTAGRDAKHAGFALEAIRLAGFRRLHPVVPDRTAFGAATEGEAQGHHAKNQCQSPEHRRITPHAPIIGA